MNSNRQMNYPTNGLEKRLRPDLVVAGLPDRGPKYTEDYCKVKPSSQFAISGLPSLIYLNQTHSENQGLTAV